MVQPVKVFLCYTSSDLEALEQLRQQLKLLERTGLIETWYNRQILPGADYVQEIEARLNQAQVIILLVSSTFLASEYCDGKEMEHALQLHREARAVVVPVQIEPSLWDLTPLGDLQALPDNNKPVSEWRRASAAWVNVAVGIRELATAIHKRAESEVTQQTASTKTSSKPRKATRTKRAPAGGPITEAIIAPRSARTVQKMRVMDASQATTYIKRETITDEEPEPVTAKARKATPEYDQHYGSLQDKIHAVCLKILVWEPDTPGQGLVAENRRAISRVLEDEKHECWLGKELSVPPGASLQDMEIEKARQTDTTILLFEPPDLGEMSEFCKHEEVIEKTLVFYPQELKSSSKNWTLEKRIRVRFHLRYYQEQDIILNHVQDEVLDWVTAQRSFRYSNIGGIGQ